MGTSGSVGAPGSNPWGDPARITPDTGSRPGDIRDSLASLDRNHQVLGYQPTVSFPDVLRHTVEAELKGRRT